MEEVNMDIVNERWIERQQADESLEKTIRRVENFDPTEYMKWLANFAKEWESFEGEDWDNDKSDISYEDYMNVQMLDVFYKVIEKYANKNYISSNSNILGLYDYCIEYKGEYYRIACNKRDTYFSYGFEKYINNGNVIPFDNIITPNKEQVEKTNKIKGEFCKIESLFSELISEGVHINVVEREVKKILNNLKFKNI